MPERRLPMRQIKEVLRLHHEAHLSERQIARACQISRSTVQRYWNVPPRPNCAGRCRRTPPTKPNWNTSCSRRRPPVRSHPRRSPISPNCTRSSKPTRTSPCNCSGRSSSNNTRTGRTTVGSASSIAPGPGTSTSCYARIIAPARKSSSTTPATRSPSSTPPPGNPAPPTSSSPCSVPVTTLTPKPPGRAVCRTGSVRIRGCWSSSAVPRAWSCPISGRRG